MTSRDIQDHLAEIYGMDASPGLISQITKVVADEINQPPQPQTVDPGSADALTG
jgi:transposase-like protein